MRLRVSLVLAMLAVRFYGEMVLSVMAVLVLTAIAVVVSIVMIITMGVMIYMNVPF